MSVILQQWEMMPKRRANHPGHTVEAHKACAACGYLMSANDRHRKCQTCRNGCRGERVAA